MEYTILPFRFERLNEGSVFLSNFVGEYTFLSSKDFADLCNYQLDSNSDTYYDLLSKQIIAEKVNASITDMLAIKYRTKKSILDNFTGLHMVVPTLRCNSNCIYCQVSRKNLYDKNYDMAKSTAKNIVDKIFKSPSPMIKIEFQGGEPLAHFEMVKYIVELAEIKNLIHKKNLEFVICTNLSLITGEHLNFFEKHKVNISTSLDGPQHLHNTNRPLQKTEDSYKVFVEKLRICQDRLGKENISALMTTTSFTINHFKAIIDEYLNLGFNSIFLRSLNPYGFAKRDKHKIAYGINQFVESYKAALDYIINVNLSGHYLVEGFTQLLLARILTPFATGFVDLQSPAGVGISGVIYDFNGNVYVSDEARMMASTNNHYFLMGNVNTHSYEDLFNSSFLRNLIRNSISETLPDCWECAYQPYCGADPVRNYSEQGDIIGYRPTSDFCKKHKSIINHLFELIRQNDDKINNVFWSWINRKPIESVAI